MIQYLVYELATGRINSVYEGHSGPIPHNETIEAVALGENIQLDQHYFDLSSSQVKMKEIFPFEFSKVTIDADGVDSTILSGLPENSTVIWPDGETTLVDDGEVEFSVDLQGSYTFQIESVEYFKKEITIEAVN